MVRAIYLTTALYEYLNECLEHLVTGMCTRCELEFWDPDEEERKMLLELNKAIQRGAR